MPAFGASGAAELAAAALADTFDAARGCGADRVIVSFAGDPRGVVPDDFTVVPQRVGPFAERLAGAWADADGPGVQIGMDTPQVTAADLDRAFEALGHDEHDTVLGPALDGGWWAIGLPRAVPGAFDGVAMSTATTGRQQAQRLEDLGYSVGRLATMRDVDEPA